MNTQIPAENLQTFNVFQAYFSTVEDKSAADFGLGAQAAQFGSVWLGSSTFG